MAKFQVTVADASGAKLYDEMVEAAGPMEACAKAVEDARVASEAAAGAAPLAGAMPAADAPGDVGAIG